MGYIKLKYYVKNVLLDTIPRSFFSIKPKKYEGLNIEKRINYYNKLTSNFNLTEPVTIEEFRVPKKLKTYYFDLISTLRFFSKNKKFNYVFGDVTKVPDEPSFVKSRPIHGDHKNSVILKLNKVRHFNFVNDTLDFKSKKNILIGRSQISSNQIQRIQFYEKYFGHPLCDLGAIRSPRVSATWSVPKLSIEEHLKYKFILAIEGNDVATNLKWIMSSNSIAVSPQLKYETWFMEGTLIPDYHFICIKDDYSDLEEKLHYYIENTDKALEIINNAHQYVNQFKNKKTEKTIALAVAKKYFDLQEA